MPKYTTGKIAKLCGVSVRTVQYYDSINLLSPSELSEGGRRLYSEQDLRRMKLICFLRSTSIPLVDIGKLLAEKNPDSVISVLLKQQEQTIKKEIKERRAKLELITDIQRELKNANILPTSTIGDIAYKLRQKKKLKQIRAILIGLGIPIGVLQIISISSLISSKIWWPFVIWLALALSYAFGASFFYFKKISYICPHCHQLFRPNFKEMLLARHTPELRNLTCVHCGYHGFCIEVYENSGSRQE